MALESLTQLPWVFGSHCKKKKKKKKKKKNNVWKRQYYRYNPEYWDRQAWANSVENTANDQGLHNLPLIQQYFK